MSAGFVALWKNNPREYVASPRDEWGTTEAIQAAFSRGRERGNRTYGLYFCRWSSAWQYMTFWVSPGLDAVFATIADLEQAGDFKFADSWHIFGEFIADTAFLSEGAWDVVPEPEDDEPPPYGMVLLERGSVTGPRAQRDRDGLRAPSPRETRGQGRNAGIRLYGAFDCRFSTGWERFTFVTAPNGEALADYLTGREREGAWRGVETFATTGRLDRFFRFGNHLQTSLTWLNEEEGGA